MEEITNKILPTYSGTELKVWSLLTDARNTENPMIAYNLANQAGELALKLGLKSEYADSCLIHVGILEKNGAYNEAMAKNMEALSFFKGSKYPREEAICWRNLGVIYNFLGEHEKQLEYNTKCYEITKGLNDKAGELIILNNIGDNYLSLKNYEKALEIFKSNLENSDYDKNIKCVSLKNIGATYYLQKEYYLAIDVFQKTSELANEIKSRPFQAAAHFYLGKINYDKQEYKKSLTYLENSFHIMEDLSNLEKEKLKVLEPLIANCLKLNLSVKALEYYNTYNTINKELKKRISNQTIKNIQFKFEIQEIENEKEVLHSQNKLLQLVKEKIEYQKKRLEEKSFQLEKINQELKNFAHVVSHDIKEPIRTIQNYSVLLKKELKDHNSKEVQEYLRFVESSSDGLTRFVSDILNHTTTGQSEMRTSKKMIDCNDIVFLIGQSLKLKLQESNGTINCTKLPIVMGHRSLLLQVFQNLISNALKFRKDDVAPVINIHWLEKGSFYEFRLEDNGIGIQEKHIDNIFHLFTRLNSPTDFEGSGIGLSTVQKILNLYNGDIRVESVLGEGTTFIFTLPKPGELIL